MLDVINHHGRQSGGAAFSENCTQGGWGGNSIPPHLFLLLVSFVSNETGELGLERKIVAWKVFIF